jgi:hypothetical protein
VGEILRRFSLFILSVKLKIRCKNGRKIPKIKNTAEKKKLLGLGGQGLGA